MTQAVNRILKGKTSDGTDIKTDKRKRDALEGIVLVIDIIGGG